MIQLGKDPLPSNYLTINVRVATSKQIHHVSARIRLEYQRTPRKIFRAQDCLVFLKALAGCVELGIIMASASYNDGISEYRQALATDVSAD
jgi:hypothetical protein